MATLASAVVEIRADSTMLRRALSQAERETRSFASRAGVAVAGMAAGFAAAGAAIAAVGGGLAAAQVMRTTAEFERLQGSLATVTGSAERGQSAFAMLMEFAKTTPFDLQQVTEAFIRLEAMGLSPSKEGLVSIGNTASAMGKTMLEFTEAIADAATGENERLKEFGIVARQQGDKVAFTFQGVTTVVEKNAAAVQKYLIGIGNTKFVGAMDRQVTTLGGALSNVGDAFEVFQNQVGQGGFGAAIADVSREIANFLGQNEQAARSIGSGLGVAVSSATQAFRDFRAETEDTFWGNVGEGVTVLANTFGAAQSYVVAFGQAYTSAFSQIGTSSTSALAYVRAFGSEVLSGAASSGSSLLSLWASAINGVVGAFVAGYRVVTTAWDQLPAAFRDAGIRAANALIQALNGAIAGTIAPLNAIIAQVNTLGANIPAIQAPSFAPIENAAAGAADKIRSDLGGAVSDAFSTDYLGKASAAVQGEIAKISTLATAYKDAAAQKRAALGGAANDNKPAPFEPTKAAAGGSFGKSGGGRGGEGGGRSKMTANDRFADDLQQIRDRTAALQAEAAAVGMSYGIQEQRRVALQLEQSALADLHEEARRKGVTDLTNIKLSGEQIARIREVSKAYGDQAASLRLVEDAQRKSEEAAGQFYDSFKQNMISAIQGASSLKDALAGVLQKLGDMLLNSAFDMLLQPGSGSSAGGVGGGIFAGIGKLLGFDEGGYTGAGGKHQIAGAVHKGEFVFDAAAVRRLGVGNLEMLRRMKGYAAGGPVGVSMPSISVPSTIMKPSISMPRTVSNSGPAFVMNDNRVINAQGADPAAIARLEAKLAKSDAELQSKVVTAVRNAQARRVL